MERNRLLVKGVVVILMTAVGAATIAAGFVLVSANNEASPEMARMMRAMGQPIFSVGLVAFMSLFVWFRRRDAKETDDDMS